AERLQVRAGGLGSPLREIEVVGVGANAVGVSDDQNIRVRILSQAAGQLLQVRPAIREDLRRIEWEQNTRRESDCDSLTYAGNRRARNFLLQLLCLLIHLVTNDRARGAADHCTNDGTTRGRSGRISYHSADGGTRARTDDSPALLLTHSSATTQNHRSCNEQRAQCARSSVRFHSTVPWMGFARHSYKLGANP